MKERAAIVFPRTDECGIKFISSYKYEEGDEYLNIWILSQSEFQQAKWFIARQKGANGHKVSVCGHSWWECSASSYIETLLKAFIQAGTEPFTIYSKPDWNGGRYLAVVNFLLEQEDLGDYEYIEWQGDCFQFAEQLPEFHSTNPGTHEVDYDFYAWDIPDIIR